MYATENRCRNSYPISSSSFIAQYIHDMIWCDGLCCATTPFSIKGCEQTGRGLKEYIHMAKCEGRNGCVQCVHWTIYTMWKKIHRIHRLCHSWSFIQSKHSVPLGPVDTHTHRHTHTRLPLFHSANSFLPISTVTSFFEATQKRGEWTLIRQNYPITCDNTRRSDGRSRRRIQSTQSVRIRKSVILDCLFEISSSK